MGEREVKQAEIEKLGKEINILTRIIDNCDRNVTALIEQKSRHMDRRDLLERKKAKLEAELALIPEEEAGV
jgi:hypothetical protein